MVSGSSFSGEALAVTQATNSAAFNFGSGSGYIGRISVTDGSNVVFGQAE